MIKPSPPVEVPPESLGQRYVPVGGLRSGKLQLAIWFLVGAVTLEGVKPPVWRRIFVPSDDGDDDELREWLGEDFDPERFDIDAVNRELLELFRPAPPRKKRSTRSK